MVTEKIVLNNPERFEKPHEISRVKLERRRGRRAKDLREWQKSITASSLPTGQPTLNIPGIKIRTGFRVCTPAAFGLRISLPETNSSAR